MVWHQFLARFPVSSGQADFFFSRLQDEGGIEGFLQREVLPYAPDAWVAPESVKIGYEISFNRYFYKPQPMRTPGGNSSGHCAGGKGDGRIDAGHPGHGRG